MHPRLSSSAQTTRFSSSIHLKWRVNSLSMSVMYLHYLYYVVTDGITVACHHLDTALISLIFGTAICKYLCYSCMIKYFAVVGGLIVCNVHVCTMVHACGYVHVNLSNDLNDGNTINQHQCQVIKDPEKTQDPAGIRTQDLLITSQTLLPLSHWISCGRGV